MNERIKQLAEQAGFELNPAHFNHEKFAQLIVRECANIADEYDGAGSTIVSRIKKHFGVEE
jgi:hypothetical protein